MTGSAKTSYITHDRKFNFFSATNTKTHQYTIKFHCQNSVDLSGLLLLAAFSKPNGNLYEWSESLMKLWWEGRGLCVTVKLRGAEWRPLLSLSHHFSWLWPSLVHIKVYFTSSPLPEIFHESFACHPAPHHPPIVELTWYYHLRANLSKKIAGNWFLVYLIRG